MSARKLHQFAATEMTSARIYEGVIGAFPSTVLTATCEILTENSENIFQFIFPFLT